MRVTFVDNRLGAFAALGLVAGCGGAAFCQAPSANELLHQVAQAEKEQSALRTQYYFRMHTETVVLDDNGKPGKQLLSEDSETVFLGGAPYSVPTQRNGKPLSDAEAKKIKDEMRRAFEERRTYRTGGAGSLHVGFTNPHYGSYEDLARLMENTIVREDEVNGRKAWVLRSRAPKDAAGATPRDAEILSYSHLLWIDQADKTIARREIETAGPQSKMGPGARLTQVFAKQEGTPWLIREATYKSQGTYIFRKRDFLNTDRFTGYKKFDAQTTITFEPEPGQPPD